MCLGIPLKIVEVNGKEALGEMNGVTTKLRIDLINDVKIGDYVMVHAGFAIEKINEDFANETLEILDELQQIVTD